MTREDIVKTAFKVWGRDLYRTTSLTDVARELGVSKPALYRHFKDKEALLKAMYSAFFNDCAGFIKEGYDRAVSVDLDEGCIIMMRSFAEYFIRNRDAFIFSLVRVFGRQEMESVSAFSERGMDFKRLVFGAGRNGTQYPSKLQLIVITTVFNISIFHRFAYKRGEQPSETLIKEALARMEKQVSRGLGLDARKVAGMNYRDLEEQAAGTVYLDTESNVLLRAVAKAVAEAGPWNASMEMVAKHSGLSKSGLYAHFKSKQDMLGKLFITEYVRILNFARAQVENSEVPEEQLYLAIITIVNYLRSRPEILVAIDWIRTRRLELGRGGSGRLYRIIRNIKLEAIRNYNQRSLIRIAQWILFLIVNTLAWWSIATVEDSSAVKRNHNIDWTKNVVKIPNESFRFLFRFIALGLEGLNDDQNAL